MSETPPNKLTADARVPALRQATSEEILCQLGTRRNGSLARSCPYYYDLLFHVTPVPTSSRFKEVFHESLPGLHGHLSKELTRAFPHFFRSKVLFAGRQVPLVAEWIGKLPATIAPEHIRHRHIRFRTS